MAIKSDKWIRKMAQEHGMIEPFEANQIKQVNGEKVISFGTSSYGYDIRCANEFKILKFLKKIHPEYVFYSSPRRSPLQTQSAARRQNDSAD